MDAGRDPAVHRVVSGFSDRGKKFARSSCLKASLKAASATTHRIAGRRCTGARQEYAEPGEYSGDLTPLTGPSSVCACKRENVRSRVGCVELSVLRREIERATSLLAETPPIVTAPWTSNKSHDTQTVYRYVKLFLRNRVAVTVQNESLNCARTFFDAESSERNFSRTVNPMISYFTMLEHIHAQ